DRYFLVLDGVEVPVVGGPAEGTPPVHPDHEERGRRHIPVDGAVRVEAEDLPPNGERVWLKGLGCVRHVRDAFEYVGDDVDLIREEGVDVIHWVPAEGTVPVCLRTMEGDRRGRAEPDFADADVDDVVQFERVGYARVDSRDDEEVVAYFAHE
ncbi:MAG: glutamate--tRNA ligase, partial [Salinigranum sp.]